LKTDEVLRRDLLNRLGLVPSNAPSGDECNTQAHSSNQQHGPGVTFFGSCFGWGGMQRST